MSNDHGQSQFERRAGELLRAGADELDGATRAKLARARRAALEAAGPRGWLHFRYLAPAGAMAAALLVTVLLVGRGEGPVNDAAPGALYDMELLADSEGLDLAEESDLEFIEWAAEIARQEGAGG